MKFICLGLSPLNWLVISGLVPTGFPPNISPYWWTARRTFCRAVSGPTSVLEVESGTSLPAAGAGIGGCDWCCDEMIVGEIEATIEVGTDGTTTEVLTRLAEEV